MKVRAFIAALAAWSIGAGAAGAEEFSDADKATLRGAVARVQAAWGIRPAVRLDDSAIVEVSATGVVTLGSGKILPAVASVPAEARAAALTWIVAHELRHALQLRDLGGRRAGDRAWNRALECQADLEAARLLARETVAEIKGEPDKALIARLRARSFSVLQVAENLEGAASADYPSATLRRLAAGSGQHRAVYDAAERIATDPDEREALLVSSRKLLDLKDGESDSDWSLRYCQMLLHDGAGPDLVFGTPQIQWNRSAETPFVDYSVPVLNGGASVISVRTVVNTAVVPRASLEDVGLMQRADARVYEFDLAPGAEYRLTGRLIWVATEDDVPRLLFPLKEGALMMASRSPARPTPAAVAARPPLSPRLKRIATAIESIVNDAPQRFQNVVGDRCEVSGGTQTCNLKIPFPVGSEADISREGSGASNMSVELYVGTSKAEGDEAFDRMRQDLRAIYPDADLTIRTTTSGSRRVEFKPRPRAVIELREFPRSRTEGFMVFLDITPSTF